MQKVKKFRLKILYRYGEILKTKWFHSVMTSMTMFTQNQSV